MRRTFSFLLAWMLLFLLTGCQPTQHRTPVEGEPPKDVQIYEDNPLSSGSGFYGYFPKGLRPAVLVDGKLYRWAGSHDQILLAGYEPLGSFSGITEDVPTQQLQLRAAFEATGTVYADPNKPEVVYAVMSSPDWLDEVLVRFVTDDLRDHGCILYNGKQYCFQPGSDLSPWVRELPEGCALAGTLHYIGQDLVPENQLETNRPTDSYSKSVEGREVWADPNDDSVIYVYEHHYWAQGDYPAWVTCPLWE